MASRWTSEQDDLLRGLYAQRIPVDEIAARVGRSPDAVVARRRALGIPGRPRSRPWTAREETLLRAASSAGVPLAAIAARLDRSRDQVRARSRQLRRPRPPARPYLTRDDEAIRCCLHDGGDLAALATRLGRSPEAVRLRAQRLGLRHPRRRHRWQEWEDAVVRDGYTAARTCAEIASELPQRTESSVAARARRLGVATYARRWSGADDQRLAWLLESGTSVEEAALQLRRTPEAVRQRAARRQISPPALIDTPGKPRQWTPEEDGVLRLHATLNPARLAQLLDRSDRAVSQRLRLLGLRERACRSPHYTGARANGALSRLQERRAARDRREISLPVERTAGDAFTA